MRALPAVPGQCDALNPFICGRELVRRGPNLTSRLPSSMPQLRQNLLTLVLLFVVTCGALEIVLHLSGFTSSLPLLASPLGWLGLTMVMVVGVLVKTPRLLVPGAILPGVPATVAESRCLVLLGAMLPVGEGPAYAAGGVLLLLLLFNHSWRLFVGRPCLKWIGLGFGLWIVAGCLAFVFGGEGWLRPKELGRIAPFLMLPVVFGAVTRVEPLWVKRAIHAFVISLSLSCAFALLQYFSDLNAHTGFMDWIGTVSSRTQLWAPGQGERLVAGGFYFHRLKMAHVLLLGLALLAARQVFAALSTRQRALEGAVATLFLTVLFLTYTRAAILGLGVGCAVGVWFASRRWKFLFLLISLVAIGFASSDAHVRERLLSIGDGAASAERSSIWSQAIVVISDYPAGVGLGNYPTVIDRYYNALEGAERFPRTYAHNLLLSAWAETGPLGLMGYLWIWVVFGVVCWRVLRTERLSSPESRWIAAAGLMGVTAMWVVGLTHDVLYHKPVCLTFSAFLGVVLALLEEELVRLSKSSQAGPDASSFPQNPRALS